MTDCTRKTWLGRPLCRFEAVYDRGEPSWSEPNYGCSEWHIEKMAKISRAKTFAGAICKVCGKTIERVK